MKSTIQFGFDMQVSLRPKRRKSVKQPIKALPLPLTQEQKAWQDSQLILWQAAIIRGEA